MRKEDGSKKTKWNIVDLDDYKPGVKTYQCLYCKTIYMYEEDAEIMTINPSRFRYCPGCGATIIREEC